MARFRIPRPRLLPVTCAGLAVLLTCKTVDFVRWGLTGEAGPQPPTGLVMPAEAAPAEKPAGLPATAAPKLSEAKPAQASDPAVAPMDGKAGAPVADTPVSDSEKSLLQDLRARRAQLDTREKSLDTREQVMAAAEQKLNARVDELSALQAKLEQLEQARKARDEANWQGLVKLYEAMKPRDAAVIFNDLDMPVLLQVLDRMKEAKAAPILAAMQPDRARDATTKLAQMRTRENAVGAITTGG